jgi:hypothetical protein
MPNPYSDQRRTQHGQPTVKTWPNAITKAPANLPATTSKENGDQVTSSAMVPRRDRKPSNATTHPGGGRGPIAEFTFGDPRPVAISPSARERPDGPWRGRRFGPRRRFSAGQFGGRCYACGEDLPFEAFAVDRSKASGRKSICRRCDREKARAYYALRRGGPDRNLRHS